MPGFGDDHFTSSNNMGLLSQQHNQGPPAPATARAQPGSRLGSGPVGEVVDLFPQPGSGFGTGYRTTVEQPPLPLAPQSQLQPRNLNSNAYLRDRANAYLGDSRVPQAIRPSPGLVMSHAPSDAHSGHAPGHRVAHNLYYNNAPSASPEPSEAASGTANEKGAPYRRGYQACQRCRDRKVRCDLGSK
jgi:hypothetical protein